MITRVSDEQIKIQYDYIEKIRDLGENRKYCINTITPQQIKANLY